jgi:hypothetical protein
MLFNLSSRINFPSKQTGIDIYCRKDLGPCFSGSDFNGELDVWNEPFNDDDKC